MSNEELADKETKEKINKAKQYVKELSTTITKDDIVQLPGLIIDLFPPFFLLICLFIYLFFFFS